MAEHPLGEAVRQILRSLTPKSGDTDAHLLMRFAQVGDEAAFEVLLERHGPMVWRTCRRIARQTADAEDAFQATFMVLCRKARSIGKRESLGSWLHRVAYRIALKANSRSAFRTLDEKLLPACDADPAAALLQSELRPLLDEALSQLPEKYRVPLVLCCLEGKTRARAAAELGWAEGTLSSRLAQGKELLRSQLMRRGVAPSAGVLAALLAQEGTAQALPRQLLLATLKVKSLLVLAETAGSGGQIIPAVILAKGALKTMFLTKLRIAAMVFVSIGLLGTGAGTVMHQVFADKPGAGAAPFLANDEQAREKVAPLPGGPANAAAPAQEASARKLRVVVLDLRGKPLAGARVHADMWTDSIIGASPTGEPDATGDYETNAAGIAQIELPKRLHGLGLEASTKSFAPIGTLASGKEFPSEFTFRLESGVTAGGRVVDEQGKPIAGAKVQVHAFPHARPANSDGSTAYGGRLAEGNDAATTDAEGRWRIHNVPPPADTELMLLVSHPDYVSDDFWNEAQDAAGGTTLMLRQGTATVTLTRGVILRGRVTDAAGKPIAGAIIVRGDKPSITRTPSFATDADGQFRLPPLRPRETTLTVIAPGWAPQLRHVRLQDGQPPQDFRMEPGKPIQLRIVDGAGKSIPNAYVDIVGWKGANSLSPNHPNLPKRDTKIPPRADGNGLWQWTWAPSDPVKLQIYAKGYAGYELEIAGGAPARTVTLNAEPPVTGR
jgi:RNA polymerase sigma factor (sigma-70 family)